MQKPVDDDSDDDAESLRARRRRRKKRSDFLRAVAAESSSEGDPEAISSGTDDSQASFASYASNATNLSASSAGLSRSFTGDFDDDDFAMGAGGTPDGGEGSQMHPLSHSDDSNPASTSFSGGPSVALDDPPRSRDRSPAADEWDSLLEDSRAAAAVAAVGASSSGTSSSRGGGRRSSSGGRQDETSSSAAAPSSASAAAVAATVAADPSILDAIEREREQESRQASVLGRLTRHRTIVSKTDVCYLSLRSTFSVFCLSCLCAEGNTLSLADLLRLTRTGAISHGAATKNLPPAMQLRSIDDFKRFREHDLTQGTLKTSMFKMACLLDLKYGNYSLRRKSALLFIFCPDLSTSTPT